MTKFPREETETGGPESEESDVDEEVCTGVRDSESMRKEFVGK